MGTFNFYNRVSYRSVFKVMDNLYEIQQSIEKTTNAMVRSISDFKNLVKKRIGTTGTHIYVCEPNNIHRQICKIILTKNNYRVMEGCCAEDFYKVSGNDIGLLIMDLNLPDIDGLKLIRDLSYRSMPIIVLTDRYGDDKKIKELKNMRIPTLFKPIETDLFLYEIIDIFGLPINTRRRKGDL